MSDSRNPGRRHDVLEIPIIWAAIALSLLLHLAALWLWLPSLLDRAANARFGDGSRQLVAELRPAPPPSTPPAPPSAAPMPLAPPAPATTAPARPRAPTRPRASRPPPEAPEPAMRPSPPPMFSDKSPVAVAPRAAQAPSPPADAPPVAAPKESDLSAYIESRRRARGESPAVVASASEPEGPPPESDIERRDRIVASNLGLNRTPSFGYDPERAGGMFQITSLEYDYADFWFFGLNKAIGRNTKQRIEVRKGSDSDIRVAVVRKMIAIIREHVSGEFVWISRHGPVTMSARPSDNAALEAFVIRDVFPDFR